MQHCTVGGVRPRRQLIALYLLELISGRYNSIKQLVFKWDFSPSLVAPWGTLRSDNGMPECESELWYALRE